MGRLGLAAVPLCRAQQSACCCRVTPRGGQPVEADTASKAWAGLYAGNSKESARALGCSGAKQFGLAHPRVRKLLHKLSGATRCEAYADWEGEAPSIPPLVRLVSERYCPNITIDWAHLSAPLGSLPMVAG